MRRFDHYTPFIENYAEELVLYILNDEPVYRAYLLPVAKSLHRHYVRGTFDLDLGIKAMRRCADQAAKSYVQQYGGMTEKWSETFSSGDRTRAARELAERFVAGVRSGDLWWT